MVFCQFGFFLMWSFVFPIAELSLALFGQNMRRKDKKCKNVTSGLSHLKLMWYVRKNPQTSHLAILYYDI